MNPILHRTTTLFDALEGRWERAMTRKLVAGLLVASFLVSLAAIEANRLGLLPGRVADSLPTNHFAAVHLAFTLLLVLEVLGLDMALADSVAASVGKQFQLLALILLRKAFMEFAEFGEPIVWGEVSDAVLHMVAYAVAALLIFVILGFYYRVQPHRRITDDDDEQARFVAAKKGLALGLLGSFVVLGAVDAVYYLGDGPAFDLFAAFYLVLIFSDVLIVLISQAYSSAFQVLFRNSGFALATVLMRLALTAPPYVAGLLGVASALFALSLSLAHREFAPVLRETPDPVH